MVVDLVSSSGSIFSRSYVHQLNGWISPGFLDVKRCKIGKVFFRDLPNFKENSIVFLEGNRVRRIDTTTTSSSNSISRSSLNKTNLPFLLFSQAIKCYKLHCTVKSSAQIDF